MIDNKEVKNQLKIKEELIKKMLKSLNKNYDLWLLENIEAYIPTLALEVSLKLEETEKKLEETEKELLEAKKEISEEKEVEKKLKEKSEVIEKLEGTEEKLEETEIEKGIESNEEEDDDEINILKLYDKKEKGYQKA